MNLRTSFCSFHSLGSILTFLYISIQLTKEGFCYFTFNSGIICVGLACQRSSGVEQRFPVFLSLHLVCLALSHLTAFVVRVLHRGLTKATRNGIIKKLIISYLAGVEYDSS